MAVVPSLPCHSITLLLPWLVESPDLSLGGLTDPVWVGEIPGYGTMHLPGSSTRPWSYLSGVQVSRECRTRVLKSQIANIYRYKRPFLSLALTSPPQPYSTTMTVLSSGKHVAFFQGLGEIAGSVPPTLCLQSPVKGVKIRGWRSRQKRCWEWVGWTFSASLRKSLRNMQLSWGASNVITLEREKCNNQNRLLVFSAVGRCCPCIATSIFLPLLLLPFSVLPAPSKSSHLQTFGFVDSEQLPFTAHSWLISHSSSQK